MFCNVYKQSVVPPKSPFDFKIFHNRPHKQKNKTPPQGSTTETAASIICWTNVFVVLPLGQVETSQVFLKRSDMMMGNKTLCACNAFIFKIYFSP